ncbi:hypothetical protein CEXT_571731 [Caerostris extrusa]|uniref:Uncharacterized protein n=1 Tax=Caerostris extrusa TaxID=172846 RepID=A0AAV4PIH1_CAEEX|nr:hypothetical protein CEXT_571731 [Caerostris extrusa]
MGHEASAHRDALTRNGENYNEQCETRTVQRQLTCGYPECTEGDLWNTCSHSHPRPAEGHSSLQMYPYLRQNEEVPSLVELRREKHRSPAHINGYKQRMEICAIL